jgi:hypothetical protein
MSIEEFALYQRANGMRASRIDGVWWAEVGPCFFRPVFPFVTIDPKAGSYPPRSWLGGRLHAVPTTAAANSRINLFAYADLQDYSIGGLSEKQRHNTRKGLRNFHAAPLTDVGEFVEQAYEPYVESCRRSQYCYRRERLTRPGFAAWAELLFRHRKLLITGVYHRDKLVAVDTSCRIEDVVYDDVFFSDTESLSRRVADFVLHIKREAVARTDARYLLRGLPTGKQSLDESKLARGCQVLRLPAHCRLNPVAALAARLVMKDSYRKLRGLTGDRGTLASEPP